MGLSIFMAFSVDGVVITLSGVQMARFIYGMALWCLLDKGPEIITCCYPWNDSPQACVRRQRQIMVFLVGLWAASIFGMTLLISTCVRFRPLLCQMKCVILSIGSYKMIHSDRVIRGENCSILLLFWVRGVEVDKANN